MKLGSCLVEICYLFLFSGKKKHGILACLPVIGTCFKGTITLKRAHCMENIERIQNSQKPFSLQVFLFRNCPEN